MPWYEISNWAVPGAESRHNLAYWTRLPYEAVGPGAHAFDSVIRRWNAAPLDGWLEALVPEGERFRVFVVDSAGIAHAREVTVGGRSETAAEITSGLVGGETVVTYGAYGVSDSARIVPAKP